MASADYIKSFDGSLKTVSFTPVLVPVYDHINRDFGGVDHLNFAGKLYILLYDTDIDFVFLVGGSKANRYGIDFSRNITTNFEIHGEFALINDYRKVFIDREGSGVIRQYNATSYLLGLRYLTSLDTTFIFEYYHNGTGLSRSAMKDYFSFIDMVYQSSGEVTLLRRTAQTAKESYGRMNPMRDYIYLRISQKEPFNILYFTPAVTGIFNINDKSFSLSPELSYSAVTNLELRLKTTFLIGDTYTEYGEKASDYRLEFRIRYYF